MIELPLDPDETTENKNFTLNTYIKFPFGRTAFLTSYEGPDKAYNIALGLRKVSVKPTVQLFIGEPKIPTDFDSAIIFPAKTEALEELKKYLEDNPATTLLFAILGNAVNDKEESDHVVFIIPSEGLATSSLFILDKGERVSKGGEKVSIELKGGEKVSIDF